METGAKSLFWTVAKLSDGYGPIRRALTKKRNTVLKNKIKLPPSLPSINPECDSWIDTRGRVYPVEMGHHSHFGYKHFEECDLGKGVEFLLGRGWILYSHSFGQLGYGWFRNKKIPTQKQFKTLKQWEGRTNIRLERSGLRVGKEEKK